MLSVDDPDVGLARLGRAKLQQVQVMTIQRLPNHQQLHTRLSLGVKTAAAAAAVQHIDTHTLEVYCYSGHFGCTAAFAMLQLLGPAASALL
jgi:hypothetical protein